MFNRRNKKDEYNYFDEFAKNICFAEECATMLKQIVDNFDKSNIQESLDIMHKIENKGDEGKHNIVNYLAKDFLPPIEREDIMRLSQEIDDITDLIEDILINIDMFNVEELRPEVKEFTDLLIKCCQNEHELFEAFKNFKGTNQIKKKVIEINKLEEEGDRLYVKSMRKLYRDGTSTIDVIKWTTIYNCFENCFDRCEDVADAVDDIILKNL